MLLPQALCRSQLSEPQRKRAPLLQRAFARLASVAKSSAPPTLVAQGTSSPTGAAATSGRHGRPGTLQRRSALPGASAPSVGDGAAVGAEAGAPPEAGSLLPTGSSFTVDAGGGAGEAASRAGISPSHHVGRSEQLATGIAPFEEVRDHNGAEPRTSAAQSSAMPPSFSGLGSSLMSTKALRYYGAALLEVGLS